MRYYVYVNLPGGEEHRVYRTNNLIAAENAKTGYGKLYGCAWIVDRGEQPKKSAVKTYDAGNGRRVTVPENE